MPGVEQSIPAVAGSTAGQGQREKLCVGNKFLPKPTQCGFVPWCQVGGFRAGESCWLGKLCVG